jgi:hypothetical protein
MLSGENEERIDSASDMEDKEECPTMWWCESEREDEDDEAPPEAGVARITVDTIGALFSISTLSLALRINGEIALIAITSTISGVDTSCARSNHELLVLRSTCCLFTSFSPSGKAAGSMSESPGIIASWESSADDNDDILDAPMSDDNDDEDNANILEAPTPDDNDDAEEAASVDGPLVSGNDWLLSTADTGEDNDEIDDAGPEAIHLVFSKWWAAFRSRSNLGTDPCSGRILSLSIKGA